MSPEEFLEATEAEWEVIREHTSDLFKPCAKFTADDKSYDRELEAHKKEAAALLARQIEVPR